MKRGNELFSDNVRLAETVAQASAWTILSYEERRQAALIGLWKACRSYDPTRGSSLAAYARPWMNKSIRQAATEKRWLSALGYSVLSLDQPPGSHPADQDGSPETATYHELVEGNGPSPEQEAIAKDCATACTNAAAAVVRQHEYRGKSFGASDVVSLLARGNTQAEIAKILGVTRQRVNQLVMEIKRKYHEEHER